LDFPRQPQSRAESARICISIKEKEGWPHFVASLVDSPHVSLGCSLETVNCTIQIDDINCARQILSER
jgi:hypothetical protein